MDDPGKRVSISICEWPLSGTPIKALNVRWWPTVKSNDSLRANRPVTQCRLPPGVTHRRRGDARNRAISRFPIGTRARVVTARQGVGDVPAAVNHTDNFDHAGTFAVEYEIVTMGEQPQPKSSVREDLSQFWLIRE
jgi:hypothetical protein